MGTVVLFVTLILLVALFAIFFICYQSQQRGRELRLAQQAAAAAAANQHAAIIFSTPVGHFPDSPGSAGQQLDQQFVYPPQPQSRLTSSHQFYNRKTPTPPSIISNLPVVKYEACLRRPPAAAAPAGTSQAGGSLHAVAAVVADDQDGKDTAGSSRSCSKLDQEPEQPQCVICCCEYQQGDMLKLLPCLHSFHDTCIDAWLARDHTCPICLADVVLAAGLSLRDWSTHTLERVNVVSGADHTPTAAASTALANTRAIEAPEGPGTQPAASLQQQQQMAVNHSSASSPRHQRPALPVSSTSSPRVGGSAWPSHVVLDVWPAYQRGSPAAGLPGS